MVKAAPAHAHLTRNPAADGLDPAHVSKLKQTVLSLSILGIRKDVSALLRHMKATRVELDPFVKPGLAGEFLQEVMAGRPLELGREAAISHSAAALVAADAADQSIAQGSAGAAESFVMLGLRQVTMAAGACLGLSLGRLATAGTEAVSAVAKKAASARHAEHRAMRAEVLAHYAAHKHEYRSKDAAA